MMRMAERAMARRAAAGLRGSVGAEEAEARAHPRSTHRGQGAHREQPDDVRGTLRVLSSAMKLDLLLFGRIRSGPFFALLVKE